MVDDQLWDAQQLLNDPDHEVQSKLSEAQQQEIRESLNDAGINGQLGILLRLIAFAVFLFLVALVVSKV